jgi:hypothetical protein
VKAQRKASKRGTEAEEAWFSVRVDIEHLALLITTNFPDGSTSTMSLNAKEAALLNKELSYGSASLESVVQHRKKHK